MFRLSLSSFTGIFDIEPIHSAMDYRHMVLNQYTPMTPHFKLDFPGLPLSSYADLSVRTELAPMSTAAFVPLPAAQIIQISMTTNYVYEEEPDCYDICLSREKLLHLFSLEHLSDSGQSLVKLAWEVWGEHTTRWFQTCRENHLISSTYGSRHLQAI